MSMSWLAYEVLQGCLLSGPQHRHSFTILLSAITSRNNSILALLCIPHAQ